MLNFINDGHVPVSSTPKFMPARPPEMGGSIVEVMKLCDLIVQTTAATKQNPDMGIEQNVVSSRAFIV